MLNGLLLCGLVYLALAGALAICDWTSGMAYMFVFGADTLPLLLAFTVLGHKTGQRWQKYLRKAYPVIITGMGLFLIWRAVQFQLPGEFNRWEALNNAPICH